MPAKARNKKAEPKPRFLDVEMRRRFIRGRQSIDDYLLARLCDGSTTAVTDIALGRHDQTRAV
ncbi:hypothetical protein D3227_17195 [Mesorhizobium waimense]|uniref:Uncharacterized protein n=1 Tax=Mesorhizobium waimense TaxID=1300307 RepID=A0A3A5KVL2_9HYPH|nr:hypothetical protein D3227_17195 [Mesorhizobium waimense]